MSTTVKNAEATTTETVVKNQEREIRVFKNKNKEKVTQPDFRALFTIDGKKYVATLYIRESKDKVEYFGGRIFDYEEQK